MRILIAEDDGRVAGLLKGRFKADGVAADVCHTGLEAVALARAVEYDVLAMDIMMPELDGLEAVRRLRAEGLETPVIFLTARDAVEDRVLGLNAGADDYLVTPFAYEELLARVRADATSPHPGGQRAYRGGPFAGRGYPQRLARWKNPPFNQPRGCHTGIPDAQRGDRALPRPHFG